MAFTCYLLLNADYDSLKLKNVAPSYEKLYSYIFFFCSSVQNFVYGEQPGFEATCDACVTLGHYFG